MVRIVIPDYRAKSRNKTITSHWRTYQKYRDEIAEFMLAYAKRDELYEMDNATVEIEAFFKGKRTIDVSNLDDKLIVDGLQKLGVLPDDTPEFNKTVVKTVVPESGKDELVIMVSGDVYEE